MLKNLSRLEHTVGNKVYHFVCDCDSPLSDVKESLFEFMKYVGKIEDMVKAQQEQAQAMQADSKEEAKTE